MIFSPELLTFADGTKLTGADDWIKRRKEIVDILSKEEYGFLPPAPVQVQGEAERLKERCCSGHAYEEIITLSFDTPKGEFSFPMRFFVPNKDKKYPLIIMINFSADRYHKYCPVEEIIDNGFALAQIYYNDITRDNDDFTDGLAAMYDRDENTGFGKISLWAFGISRAIDYFIERDEIDTENIAVAGHSRLGKTALWCAANDERVHFACSNDSGCCGAAYERVKHDGAESIKEITEHFPYWFCGNYFKYVGRTDEMPFDQHFVIAACAPRFVCVGNATEDLWADPYSGQLSCIGASPAWEFLGLKGFIGKEEPAECGERFAEGDICYHLRDGTHFFGRADWHSYMEFIKDKIKK